MAVRRVLRRQATDDGLGSVEETVIPRRSVQLTGLTSGSGEEADGASSSTSQSASSSTGAVHVPVVRQRRHPTPVTGLKLGPLSTPELRLGDLAYLLNTPPPRSAPPEGRAARLSPTCPRCRQNESVVSLGEGTFLWLCTRPLHGAPGHCCWHLWSSLELVGDAVADRTASPECPKCRYTMVVAAQYGQLGHECRRCKKFRALAPPKKEKKKAKK